MPIATSEVKLYRSAVVDNTSSNGGRMDGSNEVVDNVTNNNWPDILPADLSAGATIWRKLHYKFQDTENLTAATPRVFIDQVVAGDAEGYIAAGTHTNTQGDLSSPNLYGAGSLNSSVSAGATSIAVLVDDGTVTIFRDTEKIYIDDGTNAEFATINGTPSVAGDVVTISLSAGLSNGYTAGSGTKISSCYEPGDVSASIENVTDTNNLFDETQATAEHAGGIYENWTLEYTSTTEFTLTGDTKGLVGSGNVSSTFQPNNPDTGTPYITIPAAAHEGSPSIGNQVTFRTVPATISFWEKLVYPAGSSAGSGRTFDASVYFNSP